jgi:hypothetical protein
MATTLGLLAITSSFNASTLQRFIKNSLRKLGPRATKITRKMIET